MTLYGAGFSKSVPWIIKSVWDVVYTTLPLSKRHTWDSKPDLLLVHSRMRQNEVGIIERKLTEDRGKYFRGVARIRFEHLYFSELCSRNRHDTIVDYLKDKFKSACLRLEPKHRIPAIIEPRILDAAIDSCLETTLERLLDNPSGLPPEPKFPVNCRVECFHGRQRFEAAREVLPPKDWWWTVDLYIKGKLKFSCHTQHWYWGFYVFEVQTQPCDRPLTRIFGFNKFFRQRDLPEDMQIQRKLQPVSWRHVCREAFVVASHQEQETRSKTISEKFAVNSRIQRLTCITRATRSELSNQMEGMVYERQHMGITRESQELSAAAEGISGAEKKSQKSGDSSRNSSPLGEVIRRLNPSIGIAFTPSNSSILFGVLDQKGRNLNM